MNQTWLEALFRWIHVVAGITWVGHLYFFNFVNAQVAKTYDPDTRRKVVPQLMPLGVEETLPVPVPDRVTVRVRVVTAPPWPVSVTTERPGIVTVAWLPETATSGWAAKLSLELVRQLWRLWRPSEAGRVMVVGSAVVRMLTSTTVRVLPFT